MPGTTKHLTNRGVEERCSGRPHVDFHAAPAPRPTPAQKPVRPDRPVSFRLRGAAGGIAILAATLAVLVSVDPFPRTGGWNDIAWDGAAWLMFVAGATFRFWATLYVGGRKEYMLVDKGPYSLCRHPLYLGTFLIWMSAAVFLRSFVFSAGVLAAILFYAWGTIRAEERRLTQILGAAYENYCRCTPRFVPRLSSWKNEETFVVDTKALATEWRRAL